MNLISITFPEDNYLHKIAEIEAEKNLIYYASEVAEEVGFASFDELQESITRSMAVCIAVGLPIKNNFGRIFKSTSIGIVVDWRLSLLAYRLVQINGNTSNNLVAELQIKILKHFYQ